jgi:hypothetical protein
MENQRMADERAETYTGPERRKCAKDAYCINLSQVKIEFEGFRRETAAEYRALNESFSEVRGMVAALPKEISAQIERRRHETDAQIASERQDLEEKIAAERADLEAKIAAERKEMDHEVGRDLKEVDDRLDRGNDDFKEVFHRLRRVERAVLALTILVGLIECGKGVAYVWSWVATK